jgi:transposase
VYDTGGMRRTHLRGHPNILKRLLAHASGFNLGILMRHVCGRGTPRGLQGHPSDARSLHIAFAMLAAWLWVILNALLAPWQLPPRVLLRSSACASA